MVLYFFIGVFVGIITGLLPGMHSNTIISILAPLGLANEDFSFFILGLLPAHLITSFIPSIFFGIPEQRSVVSMLAGQRMLLKGEGLNALKVVLVSIIIAALFAVTIFYLSLDFIPNVYSAIRPYVGHIVLILSVIFILRTKNPVLSLFAFLTSGLLGYYSLNSGMKDGFLPLFSGLFAMGGILNYAKQKIPEQKETEIKLDFVKFAIIGTILGLFADLLPGISSPSQVSALISIFVPLESMHFLAAIASITTSEAIFSFATSATIEKSRHGAIIALSNLININENLFLVLLLFLLSVAITSAIIFHFRKIFAGISNLDFSKINLLLALYLIFVVFVINGFSGLILFALASGLGFLTVRLGIERTNLMGAVILPTLMLLFRIFI